MIKPNPCLFELKSSAVLLRGHFFSKMLEIVICRHVFLLAG